MQKIVFFIEPSDHAFDTPFKIGNLFMNRFAVDEDAASEILKIFELEKTSLKISEDGIKRKGIDPIIKIDPLVWSDQTLVLDFEYK